MWRIRSRGGVETRESTSFVLFIGCNWETNDNVSKSRRVGSNRVFTARSIIMNASNCLTGPAKLINADFEGPNRIDGMSGSERDTHRRVDRSFSNKVHVSYRSLVQVLAMKIHRSGFAVFAATGKVKAQTLAASLVWCNATKFTIQTPISKIVGIFFLLYLFLLSFFILYLWITSDLTSYDDEFSIYTRISFGVQHARLTRVPTHWSPDRDPVFAEGKKKDSRDPFGRGHSGAGKCANRALGHRLSWMVVFNCLNWRTGAEAGFHPRTLGHGFENWFKLGAPLWADSKWVGDERPR